MSDKKYLVLSTASEPELLEYQLNNAAMGGYAIYMKIGKTIILTKGGVA